MGAQGRPHAHLQFRRGRDPDTGLYVGHVPGWPGAHSQGATLDELRQNLHEVVEMLLEDGEPKLEAEFGGVQVIQVA
jgi:predicted RNase H-like HicB family nuclease